MDENGKPYTNDVDDAAYATFQLEGGVIAHINMSWCTRVRRDDLVTFHVDGTHGSAVAGLQKCWSQARVNTPRPVWNPDVPQPIHFFDTWQEVPGTRRLRQRLQGRVGDVHPASLRGRAVQLDAARRRQGRAAGRGRAQELEGAALDRHSGAEGVSLRMPDAEPLERSPDRPAATQSTHLLPPATRPRATKFPQASQPPPFNRIAYAAAHVVADPLADSDPWLDAAIDWDATIAFRRHLWSLGLGVAEAMDTAQRGMGLDWPNSLELIRRSLDAAKDFPGALIGSGAGTDHLAPGADVTIDDVIRAYEEQCAAVEKLGGRIILMASRALVKAARSPDDYAKVYGRILGQVKEPVIIHWLGEMFDPALDGYWGHEDHMKAMEVALDVIARQRRQGRRREDLAARQGQGDRHAPPPAAGRAHVHRRRLQLRRADRGRRTGLFRRAARHLRRHRAGGLRRARRVRPRRRRSVPRDPRADGAAVAPHLQGADPLLQDRRGVHGLSQRPAGPFHHDRRPGERALDRCISPSCSAWPTPRACSPIRSLRPQRMRARHGDARGAH